MQKTKGYDYIQKSNNLNMHSETLFKFKLKNPGCVCRLIEYNNKIKLLVTIDQEGIIYIFNTVDGKLLSEYQLECKTEVWTLDYNFISKNALFLFIGSASGVLYGLSLHIKNEVNILECAIKPFWSQKTGDMITKVSCCDINNDGKNEIIVSSLDKTLRVITYESGKYVWGQIFQHGITTFQIGKLTPESDYVIAAGTGDGTLKVFNGVNGVIISTIILPNNIRTIDIIDLPDSLVTKHTKYTEKVIICGCDNSILYVIDAENGKIVKEISVNSYVWLSKVILSLDKKTTNNILITSYSFDFMSEIIDESEKVESGIYLFDAKNLEIQWYLGNINVQSISELVTFKSRVYVGVGTTENAAYIFDTVNADSFFKIETEDIVNAIVLSKDDENLYLYFCDDKNNLVCERISDI